MHHSERHRGRYRKTSADPPAISWPLPRLAPASGQDVQLLPPLSGLPPPLRAVSLDRLLSGPRESQGPIALPACQHAHQVAAADGGGESLPFKHPPPACEWTNPRFFIFMRPAGKETGRRSDWSARQIRWVVGGSPIGVKMQLKRSFFRSLVQGYINHIHVEKKNSKVPKKESEVDWTNCPAVTVELSPKKGRK